MRGLNIFRSAKPTLRCARMPVIPMDPREQHILDQLRERRLDREQTPTSSTSQQGENHG
jgi:hypothetical protein